MCGNSCGDLFCSEPVVWYACETSLALREDVESDEENI
jgi:hypothetical protein